MEVTQGALGSGAGAMRSGATVGRGLRGVKRVQTPKSASEEETGICREQMGGRLPGTGPGAGCWGRQTHSQWHWWLHNCKCQHAQNFLPKRATATVNHTPNEPHFKINLYQK